MNRTPELSESAQIKAWRQEIAQEIADQLRPELEKQTTILEKILETQQSRSGQEIAPEASQLLRPELEKQTSLLEKMLETHLSGSEANQALIAALKQRFGI